MLRNVQLKPLARHFFPEWNSEHKSGGIEQGPRVLSSQQIEAERGTV